MRLKYIEELVQSYKNGNEEVLELLFNELKPCIINQVSRFSIPGYEFEDLMNECNVVILKTIHRYSTNTNSFTKFCVVAIRNALKNLLRNSTTREGKVGYLCYIDEAISDEKTLESEFIKVEINRGMKLIIKSLSREERELVNFIYFEGNTLQAFSIKKKIPYSLARSKRDGIFKRCRDFIHENRINCSI